MTIHDILSSVPGREGWNKVGNTYTREVGQNELAGLLLALHQNPTIDLKTVLATHEPEEKDPFRIRYVFGVHGETDYIVPFIRVPVSGHFPSCAGAVPPLAAYEREIYTMFGLIPVGHPHLRKTVLHGNWPKDFFPLRKDVAWNARPLVSGELTFPFVEAQGDGVYQIPVGPVHAGIIEPGHFRFSVLGEEVQLLDAQLGYVHKGVEKLFEHLPEEKHLTLAERISGDSSFAHALAYAGAIETLRNIHVPDRAQYIRVICAELERLANHFNDMGFIMLDAAHTFGGSHGARLRECVMRINEELTGSRQLRAIVMVGGVAKDISPIEEKVLRTKLEDIERDHNEVMAVVVQSITLNQRLENTGVLSRTVREATGAVGVPRRALGDARDARQDHPYAAYRHLDLTVPTETTGDVKARFLVRAKEVSASFCLITEALSHMPHGPTRAGEKGGTQDATQAVSIVEGWRGDIVYVVTQDRSGKITRVKVRDTSFLNWQALPSTVKGEMVPDFPLINKSFNLSYTGNDL